MTTARAEAASAGRTTYLGRACYRCGGKSRYTMNCSCVRCTKADAKQAQRRMRKLLNGGRK